MDPVHIGSTGRPPGELPCARMTPARAQPRRLVSHDPLLCPTMNTRADRRRGSKRLPSRPDRIRDLGQVADQARVEAATTVGCPLRCELSDPNRDDDSRRFS